MIIPIVSEKLTDSPPIEDTKAELVMKSAIIEALYIRVKIYIFFNMYSLWMKSEKNTEVLKSQSDSDGSHKLGRVAMERYEKTKSICSDGETLKVSGDHFRQEPVLQRIREHAYTRMTQQKQSEYRTNSRQRNDNTTAGANSSGDNQFTSQPHNYQAPAPGYPDYNVNMPQCNEQGQIDTYYHYYQYQNDQYHIPDHSTNFPNQHNPPSVHYSASDYNFTSDKYQKENKECSLNSESYKTAARIDLVSDGVVGLIKFMNQTKNLVKKKTHFQRAVLEAIYEITQYPNKSTKENLSLILNLDCKVINIWFQNRRNFMIQNKARNLEYKLNKKDSTRANGVFKLNCLLLVISKVSGSHSTDAYGKLYNQRWEHGE